MKDGIFLLLGSNQGDRAGNLAQARRLIGDLAGTITAQSSVYRSAAWGVEDQPDFYNQVLLLASSDSPEAILETILRIEQEMGRVRRQRWGPRVIDIDILFHGKHVRNTPALHLPHPGIPSRKFTLVPLAELAPDLVHPVLHKNISTLLEECLDPLAVTKVIR